MIKSWPLLIVALTFLCLGFYLGNVWGLNKSYIDYLKSTEDLLIAQKDPKATIKPTLELIRVIKREEIAQAKREFLAIFLPSTLMLVMLGIEIIKMKNNPANNNR